MINEMTAEKIYLNFPALECVSHSPFRGYWIFIFQYEISDDEFGIFPRVLSQIFSEIL